MRVATRRMRIIVLITTIVLGLVTLGIVVAGESQ
jgi:hypothetical protein